MINQAETGSGPIHAFKHENKQTNLFLFPPAIISRRGALKPIGSISHGLQGKLPMSPSTEFCNLTLSLNYFRLQLWAVVPGLKKLHCSTFQFLWRSWVFILSCFNSEQQACNQTKLHTQTDGSGQTGLPRTANRVGKQMGEKQMFHQQDPDIPLLYQWGPKGRRGIIPGKNISLGILYCPSIGNPWNVARQGLGVQGKLKKLDPWSQSMKQNREEHRKTKTKIKADSKVQIAWTTQKPLEGEQKTRARCCPSRNQRGIRMFLMLWF